MRASIIDIHWRSLFSFVFVIEPLRCAFRVHDLVSRDGCNLLFPSLSVRLQLRRDYREDKIFAPKSCPPLTPSYKDANVESNEKNENRDTKYITLTAVVHPNCAIDILSMCIMWLDIIKVKGFSIESFFLFPSFLVAEKQKILRVGLFGGWATCVVKRRGRLKKSKKKIYSHTVTISQTTHWHLRESIILLYYVRVVEHFF